MAEAAIKKRQRRAIRAAARFFRYPPGNYEVTFLDNHVFHLEVMRKKEVRRIRIVLDEIKKSDLEMVAKVEIPENFTKEVWCRKMDGRFDIKII
jgi:hypothetical protein